ncbi:hypothetical protein [Catenuloplanes japonicus]|uniref:hypothetical protein n=1 Tax=Catenuloplanes japonicus TaxID=33876 RepID=UPI000526585E|nr:hypothetical protein [Catenuloplanes japonicus]
MVSFPSSGAMDAAAGGRGPGTTVLPLLIGGDAQQILTHLTQLLTHVQTITGLIGKVSGAQTALRQAWPVGAASDGAAQKLKTVVDLFQQMTTLVSTLQGQTQAAAAVVTMTQQSYAAMVGATNPTVAALLSQPHGHPAARALSLSTTGSLASAVQAGRTQLDVIGLTRIAAVTAQLIQIADQLRTLLRQTD